jgi:molecular chaperone GrpE
MTGMSDERSGAAGADGGRVKVTDRRRFTAEGEPVPREDGGGSSVHDAAEAAPATAPESPPSGAPDPRDARLAEQAARIDELARAYAALVDDNKAFRQRLDRERTRVVEAERASVAQALLDAADDLERALAAVSGSGDGGGAAFANLVEGVRLSLGALHGRIAALGAQRIPVQGLPFDPHVAEAVDTVAVADEMQDGVVVQEVRAGWRIGDRILRPARVRVGRLARA